MWEWRVFPIKNTLQLKKKKAMALFQDSSNVGDPHLLS